MQELLNGAAGAVLCALVMEFCLWLLPAGGMAKLCRFAAALVLAAGLLCTSLKLEISLPKELSGGQQSTQQQYEQLIRDAYDGMGAHRHG